MKSKTLKKSAVLKTAGGRRSVSSLLSSALSFSRRHSKYAFVASLGVWLPKANAATLVNLDATSQPLGQLATWPNTGTLLGDFVTGAGATTNPTVVLKDGVIGIVFEADGGTAGAGSHYVGPFAPTSICTNNARTIEAWIHNDSLQDAETVVSWGRRGADGLNNAFGHGGNVAWGAVGMWGAPDIGWGNSAAQVATNRVVNRWTYIVQTFDGTTNRVYVDGRLANLEGPPASLAINTAEVANDFVTQLPIRIARESADTGAVAPENDGVFIAGRIRVHDVALSSSTVSNQFFIEKAAFNLNDTDGDGMVDWWEARYGLDKNNPADGPTDLDGDGLTNLGEFQRNTNPTDTDTDDDGVTDGNEVNRVDPQTLLAAPTNPTDADSDDDSLLDGVETDTGTFVSATNTGTDPLNGDSDGDISSDGTEVACGANPNNAGSTCGLNPLVNLDATGLPTGLLTNWINTGSLVGNFSSTNANTPAVVTSDGANGVAFLNVGNGDTGTHYVGPAAPVEVTGGSSRTIEAWVLNQTPQGEETVFGWARRGGPDGSNVSFGHGTDAVFGAMGHWGAGPDVGWAGSTNLSFTRWNHIAYTYDAATTTTRVYADGVLANSEVSAGINAFAVDTAANPLVFRVARQNDADGGPSDVGVGQMTIAKIRVYTNALDGATLKARFDSEKATFGLNDTDGDGLPDWWEGRYGLNKNDATGVNGATGNSDNDGLTNLQEYQLGTIPNDADTDDDGANDGAEVTRFDRVGGVLTTNPAPTNPLVFDTDGDGLRDGVETDTGTFVSALNTGTDPLIADTDGDGFVDGLEVSQGSNPLNPTSIPSPNPRINLISTNLALGTHTVWTNLGNFSPEVLFESTNGGGSVQLIQGVKALRFPGPGGTGPFFTGPTNPAAANLTGNPLYSMEAWIYNETVGDEEVIMGWGRRGADGLNNAFIHGTNPTWGCAGHWGAPDFPWGPNAAAIAQVIRPNQWSYLVYTYDPVAGIQRAYVNGVQTHQEAGTVLNLAAVANNGSPAPFRVGTENNDNGTPRGALRANGMSIAELRVYSRVLGTNEIAASFTTGKNFYGLGDNDNDGITDWFERLYPGCLSETNANDAGQDCDGDGLTNLQEFTAPQLVPGVTGPTNPTNPDTDGDGLSDGQEMVNYAPRPAPTDPLRRDTDDDGLDDLVETGTGTYVSPQDTGTTANIADSDGDTYGDATEVAYRIVDATTNPNDFASIPNTAVPVPLVKLDATSLPSGALATWTNLSGLPNWNFVAPTNAIANVDVINGTRAIRFFNTNYYTGHGAPASLTGNGSRSVDAWIYNPAPRATEETVFGWGRRGTALGNSAFSHGTSGPGTSPTAGGQFGAMQFFGDAGDVPWGATTAAIDANVKTSNWTHVAYTYDNLTGIKAVYADGVLAHSETNAVGTILATFTRDNTLAANALPFRVAAQNEADGTRSGAAAPNLSIAKVRVYDLALTAAQIASTYNTERVQFPGQPRITNVKVNPANGFVSFDWVPAPGRTYEVQRSSNAGDPNSWSVIATGQSGSYTNNPGGAPINFYRLRMEP